MWWHAKDANQWPAEEGICCHFFNKDVSMAAEKVQKQIQPLTKMGNMNVKVSLDKVAWTQTELCRPAGQGTDVS